MLGEYDRADHEEHEYEESLALARRGIEQAPQGIGCIRDTCVLGANLGRLWGAYEALINLEEVFPEPHRP